MTYPYLLGGIYKNATEAFDDIYGVLCGQAEKGFCQPSRVGNVVGEIIGPQIVILDPTRGIVESDIRKMPMRYAVGELLWYLSGSNMLSDIKQYSKFWTKLSDDGDTLNSAYGHRIYHRFGFDQWEYAKAKLHNLNDRQAIIHIKEASNEPTLDTPCTLSLQFLLRDGELNLITTMRSNDIWLGFPFDVFAFTALQVKMAMEIGAKPGAYFHNVGSLHLYERDWLKNGPNQDSAQASNENKV